ATLPRHALDKQGRTPDTCRRAQSSDYEQVPSRAQLQLLRPFGSCRRQTRAQGVPTHHRYPERPPFAPPQAHALTQFLSASTRIKLLNPSRMQTARKLAHTQGQAQLLFPATPGPSRSRSASENSHRKAHARHTPRRPSFQAACALLVYPRRRKAEAQPRFDKCVQDRQRQVFVSCRRARWQAQGVSCHLCDNSNPGCRRAGGRGAPCPCAVNGSCPGLASRSDLGSVPPSQNRRVTRRRGSENASAIFIPLL